MEWLPELETWSRLAKRDFEPVDSIGTGRLQVIFGGQQGKTAYDNMIPLNSFNSI
jgi:hypothetical protein